MNAPLRALFVVTGLVLAAAGGYWFGRVSPATPAPPATSAPAPDVVRLRAENQRLRADNERLARKQAESTGQSGNPAAANATAGAAATGMQALNALTEIQRTRAGMIRINLIERNGRLAEGFVQLFQVTPAEREQLQRALDDAEAQTTKLAMANATVKVEADALVATIPPFEGGADIYDGVMDAFARSLGPERNQAFVTLQASQLSNALSGFGAERRTVTITRESRPNGESQLSIRDERKGTNSNSSSGSGMPLADIGRLWEQFPWLESHAETIKGLPARGGPQRPATTTIGR